MQLIKQKHKLVFSIGDDGCIITCFMGKTLVKRVFAINPLSSEFEDIVNSYPNAEVYILLDNIDQTYNVSLIPPVGGSYRKKIITRKISTEFDKNDFNTYLKIGREENSRKDWKYLFISIRNAAPISDWIDAILEVPNSFKGIYLLPLESINFIKGLRGLVLKETVDKTPPKWELLVSHNRVGGIRQVVLKDGSFIFTRISQLNHSNQDIQSLSSYISQETNNTLEYIRRIGYNEQDTLNIYFVTSKDVTREIDIVKNNYINTYSFYPHKIATELNFNDVAQENDRFCDVVFAANFINDKKKNLKIDTPKSKKVTQFSGLIALVKTSAILLSIFFVLAAVYSALNVIDLSSDVKRINEEMTGIRAQLDDSKDFEKEYGVKPETLIEMVRLNDENAKSDSRLFSVLKLISEADLFGGRAMKIAYTKAEQGYTMTLDFDFDTTKEKDFSKIIVATDNFNTSITNALKGYEVKVSGLPSERKEFRVDETTTNQNEKNIKLTVTVGGGPNEN
jgi:hypothetical protein